MTHAIDRNGRTLEIDNPVILATQQDGIAAGTEIIIRDIATAGEKQDRVELICNDDNGSGQRLFVDPGNVSLADPSLRCDLSRVYFRLPFVISVNGMNRDGVTALVERLKQYFGATYRFSQEVFEEALDEGFDMVARPLTHLHGPYVGVHNNRPGFHTVTVADNIPEGYMVLDEALLDALHAAGLLDEHQEAAA